MVWGKERLNVFGTRSWYIYYMYSSVATARLGLAMARLQAVMSKSPAKCDGRRPAAITARQPHIRHGFIDGAATLPDMGTGAHQGTPGVEVDRGTM